MSRSTNERIVDAKQKLRDGGSDAWLATAHGSVPHVVPLSLAWDDSNETLLFCTGHRSLTARNIGVDRSPVRVICGSSRDVVMVDGFATLVGLVEEHPDRGHVFASQTGWNPADEPETWVYIEVDLRRVQAWRNVEEIQGRTIMKDGAWLGEP